MSVELGNEQYNLKDAKIQENLNIAISNLAIIIKTKESIVSSLASYQRNLEFELNTLVPKCQPKLQDTNQLVGLLRRTNAKILKLYRRLDEIQKNFTEAINTVQDLTTVTETPKTVNQTISRFRRIIRGFNDVERLSRQWQNFETTFNSSGRRNVFRFESEEIVLPDMNKIRNCQFGEDSSGVPTTLLNHKTMLEKAVLSELKLTPITQLKTVTQLPQVPVRRPNNPPANVPPENQMDVDPFRTPKRPRRASTS